MLALQDVSRPTTNFIPKNRCVAHNLIDFVMHECKNEEEYSFITNNLKFFWGTELFERYIESLLPCSNCGKDVRKDAFVKPLLKLQNAHKEVHKKEMTVLA